MSAPEKEEIRKRVRILRDDMKRNGIDMMLMTATDPHASEYVNDYFKAAEYFTGCTSDNIVFIVEEESARLWTDGRYFISAAEELNDTGIALMKMEQPRRPLCQGFNEQGTAEDRGGERRCHYEQLRSGRHAVGRAS